MSDLTLCAKLYLIYLLHFGPKMFLQVTGAYFEKIGSNSFAVYSIVVRDAENSAWVVKRRYSLWLCSLFLVHMHLGL